MEPTGALLQVLLVDDEQDFLDATGKALSRRGFDVHTAAEGRAALQLLQKRKVDVVVLDVKMPGVDGVELFHKIRRRQPGLPVILLTGHGSVQQAFQTSRDGVREYLSKPCDIEHLAATLRVVVKRRPPGVGLAGESPDVGADEEVRVLLVDDEQDFLDSLQRTLSRRRMRVTTAANAAEALDAFARQRFDVVLLDIKLPGMDGIELLARLRAAQPLAAVVILTGHATMGAAVEGLKLGAYDFLMKPQSIDALVSRIRAAHCESRARQRQEREREIEQLLEEAPD